MKRTRRARASNVTCPVTSAKSVSSLPWPTFSPGWCLVPRWRIRIVPALTSWPPKRFTPSRWPCESRPFVEEPPPFLCAMMQFPSEIRNSERAFLPRARPVQASLHHEKERARAGLRAILQLDVTDLHGRIVLAMAALNLILVWCLELQDDDILAAALFNDLACCCCL